MTDPFHKADERGKERKALRRAAHPEVKTKFPPGSKTGKGPWGIRYRWNRRYAFFKDDAKPSERWFKSERGRDQAFNHMARGYQLPGGRVHHMYIDLEKITR